MTETNRKAVRTAVLPLVRRALTYELSMWRSLFRWILRRPVTTGAGAKAFGYAGTVMPLLLAFIGVSAIEIPILHLILPWRIAQIISAPIGVYGLLWMIGLLASLRVHPHVVSDAGLRVRNGSTVDITIPWDAVDTIRTRNRSRPKSRAVQFDRTETDVVLHIVILSQTNIDIMLSQPTTIPLPRGGSERITELRCYADDPGALVALARAEAVSRPLHDGQLVGRRLRARRLSHQAGCRSLPP